MRLDRLIQRSFSLGRKEARSLLATGRVLVNGSPEVNCNAQIAHFDHVIANGQILQERVPRYLLLHKPAGIVSATSDQKYRTVIDLIRESWSDELHLAGRLDRFTSGLVILTNDSSFSEALTLPQKKVPKTYLVTTDSDITSEMIHGFERGMLFAKEGITTEPAIVEMLAPRNCRLTIFEGKHHQVKRMFLRFGTRVISLHRESIGQFHLNGLEPGGYRILLEEERRLVP